MARYAGWESIPMAEGGDGAVWPLPTVKPNFATWSLGGGRPWGCAQDKCERWHAGVDLTGAPQGALVIDLGKGVTDYVLYRDGHVLVTGTLPVMVEPGVRNSSHR